MGTVSTHARTYTHGHTRAHNDVAARCRKTIRINTTIEGAACIL